jgi:hypothetical protein
VIAAIGGGPQRISGGARSPGRTENSLRRPSVVRTVVTATLLSRAILWGVAFMATSAIGQPGGAHFPSAEESVRLPGHWDAGWYLGVAAGGYRWNTPDHDSGRIAFFPGYPAVVGVIGRALRLPNDEPPWLWTGVVVSTLLFGLGLFYVFQLAREILGDAAASQTTWIAAAYPFSLFYGQMYAESLFLAAVAGAWYFTRRQHYLRGAGWGLICGLTKPTGCLAATLVAWTIYEQWRQGRLATRGRTRAVLALVAPAAGLLLYAAYIKITTGSWLAWMEAQQRWGRESTNPLRVASMVLTGVRDLGLFDYVVQQPYDAANAIASLLALVAIVPVTQRFGLGAGSFVGLSVLVPLSFGGLLSIGRFTSVLFPIFMWLATLSRRPVLPIAFGVMQCVLAWMFFTDKGIF